MAPRTSLPAQDSLSPLLGERPIPNMQEILGSEIADKVAAACRVTGIRFQSSNDRASAFYMYRIARLFE